MLLWRISNHLSLTGDGALRTAGRWHSRGQRVVYCAQSPAAALLAILVHFEIDIQDLPVRYPLLKVEAPDNVAVERVSVDQLPAAWPERKLTTASLDVPCAGAAVPAKSSAAPAAREVNRGRGRVAAGRLDSVKFINGVSEAGCSDACSSAARCASS